MATETENERSQHEIGCDCPFCAIELPFEFPEGLVDACCQGRLALFAGAGISTESDFVLPYRFHDFIATELKSDTPAVSFPELMEQFVEERGRAELLRLIKDRFDGIASFPEQHGMATRFHREFGPIHQIDTVITTNWDPFFEEVNGAMPLVAAADYAFWEAADRRVLKVHGSINNPGTIVATSSDYEDCYARLRDGVLGSTLKHLLATKHIVFVGYSLRDQAFVDLYEFVRAELGDVLPPPVIVTLDPTIDVSTHSWAKIIRTDAAFFARKLREQLSDDASHRCVIGNRAFGQVSAAAWLVRMEHQKLTRTHDCRERPDVVYASAYQDGLLHATGRILSLEYHGKYSNPNEVRRTISRYEDVLVGLKKSRRYFDVAYVEGYLNGFELLLDEYDPVKDVPYYFLFGSDEHLASLEDYEAASQDARSLHKTAYAWAEKRTQGSSAPVLHHPSFLIEP